MNIYDPSFQRYCRYKIPRENSHSEALNTQGGKICITVYLVNGTR